MVDFSLFVACGFLISIIVAIVLFLLRSRIKSGDQAEEPEQPVQQNVAARVQPGPVRRRRPIHRGPQQDTDESGEDDVPQVGDDATFSGKVGAKKLKKLEEKAAKKAQREALEQERKEKKIREENLEKQRKLDEARQEAEEAAKAAEEQKLKEERDKQEYEEYLKLKEAFTVEEEGEEAENEQDNQSLLQEFINFIKETKVILLEDLAAHFKIKTQDAIDRVKTLQEEGQLSGVMDDRGKFIYITKDEYEAVAKFIKQRGRVSISELAESMNRLINLNPEQGCVELSEDATVAT